MQGFTLAAPAVPRESNIRCNTLLDAHEIAQSIDVHGISGSFDVGCTGLSLGSAPSLSRPAGLVLLYASALMGGSRPVLALIISDDVIRRKNVIFTGKLPRAGSR